MTSKNSNHRPGHAKVTARLSKRLDMRIKLTDLEATFMKITETGRSYREGVTLEEAQGVRFLCPVCFEANGGPTGTHSVLCWFRGRGVPADEAPEPGRWAVMGTGLEDLSLRPSIHLRGGCGDGTDS